MKKTDIAIIGLSGRFPKAKNPFELWENVVNGKDGITHFTDDELREFGIEEELIQNKNYVKAAAYIENKEYFEASYFGFTPAEAEVLSPQHRMALECAVEALENAGYNPRCYEDRIGIYMGAGLNSYYFDNILTNSEEIRKKIGLFMARTYNVIDTVPSMVSYKLNLKGPAVTINTACSTSLVAIHQACQALLTYDCDMALSGGISMESLEKGGYLYEPGNVLSPDGCCRAFDADGKGTAMGGGAGLVVLKRLSEAIEDNDTIYAVIEGTAINNDGIDKVGFTAPSISGQVQAILDAQLAAGVHPDAISYIEAHGTATALGDPIEVKALTDAFRIQTQRKSYCAIGSVKSNIGHLDVAAGVTGLIKTALSLKNEKIPPVLHYKKANPKINFENTPFYVNNVLRDWKTNGTPRRAGVSSFGLGGTNAHVILKEAPTTILETSPRTSQLIKLSAKTKTALKTICANLSSFLHEDKTSVLEDIAYTLHAGREEHQYKLSIVCNSKEDLIKKLDIEKNNTSSFEGEAPQIQFSFRPRKTNLVDSLRTFYISEPVFRKTFDSCVENIVEITGTDTITSYLNSTGNTDVFQNSWTPLTKDLIDFSYLLSLSKLWESWGIQPNTITATGIGLYAAACFSGVFSVKNALLLLGKKIKPEFVRFKDAKTPIFVNKLEQELSADSMNKASFWEVYDPNFSENTAVTIENQQESAKTIVLEMGLKVEKLDTEASAGILLDGTGLCYILLGKLWEQGITIDWEMFYGNERRKRIPLPTYPFERAYHWIVPPGEKEKNKTGVNKTIVTNTKLPINQWFYQPVWKEIKKGRTDSISDQHILFFSNNRSFDRKLIKKLTATNNTIILIKQAKQFKKNLHGFTMDPGDSSHYHLLWDKLKIGGVLPHRIIHGWNITPKRTKNLLKTIDKAQEIGFYSLLYLAQSIEKVIGVDNIALTVLSSDMQAVGDKEIPDPEKSTLIGPCGTIPKEYPNIKCHSVDIRVPKPNSKEENETVNTLYGLMALKEDNSENFMAIRGNVSYFQDYDRYDVETSKDSGISLRDEGVYLITGGMGSIGFVLGEYIAESYKNVKLVLTSRSEFPLSEAREDWIASFGEEDSVSEKILKIRQLEDKGAEVLVLQANAANFDEMEMVVLQAKKKFGMINGVIHAAGVIGGGSIREKEFIQAQKTLAPKVTGTLILEELLKKESLDFLVLCSSTSAVFKVVSQVDYTAANAFLDAFSKYSNVKNTIAINWDAWKEIGMAVDVMEKIVSKSKRAGKNIDGSFIKENLKNAITIEEGKEVFQFALKFGLQQIVVSTTDLAIKLSGGESSLLTAAITEKTLNSNLRDAIGEKQSNNPCFIRSLKEIEEMLIPLYMQSLGVSLILPNDDFFKLGGDSLLAVTLISNINDLLQVDLASSIIVNLPTITEMAAYIEKSLKSVVVTSVDSYNEETLTANMLKIKTGEPTKTPLILIHPVGGDVYIYKELVEDIIDGITVVGFSAKGLKKGEEPVRSVKEMARNYVKDLLKFQPEGPYRLGGSSFGGTVAYEMTQQLKEIGKEVEILFLIDTPVAKDVAVVLQEDVDILLYMVETLFSKANFSAEDLKKMAPEERLNFIAKKITNFSKNKPGYAEHIVSNAEHLDRILNVFKANILSMSDYDNHLVPYEGNMLYFKAKERREKYDPMSPEKAWLEITRKKCKVYEVAGNHFTMHTKPHVHEITKVLNSILKNC